MSPAKKKSPAKATTKSKANVESVPPAVTMASMPATIPSRKFNLNPRYVRLGLVILLIGLLAYKLGLWLFPAVVNNVPVSRITLWNRMEKAYGAQVLDDTVNEKILDAAIAKQNIQIDAVQVDTQLAELEKQFESIGGLDEALKQRGITRAELRKQVETQLAVEQILSDKVEPTEEEIAADFETNKETLYKDKKIEDVREEIRDRVRDTKLRDAFLEWFAEVKKDIKVKNFGL